MMPLWVWIIMTVIGILFGLKLLYVVSIGGLLPVTRGALFVATAYPRIEAFLEAVPMGPGERLVDLGCGDGRVLRAANRRYGVHATGFEINPLAYVAAKALIAGCKEIEIRYANFWQADLRQADVVFCYLFPDLMQKVAAKLTADLREGSRVVSCNFPLPGWEPLRILRPAPARHGDPIYLYRIPDSLPQDKP